MSCNKKKYKLKLTDAVNDRDGTVAHHHCSIFEFSGGAASSAVKQARFISLNSSFIWRIVRSRFFRFRKNIFYFAKNYHSKLKSRGCRFSIAINSYSCNTLGIEAFSFEWIFNINRSWVYSTSKRNLLQQQKISVKLWTPNFVGFPNKSILSKNPNPIFV